MEDLTPPPPVGSTGADPRVVASIYQQAWENVRHIRNERIWIGNIYVAVVAGGMAILPHGSDVERSKAVTIMMLCVLLAFSIVSLLSSIRLVAELRQAMANVENLAARAEVSKLIGVIDVRTGFGAHMPVFPIFYSIVSAAILFLLVRELRL